MHVKYLCDQPESKAIGDIHSDISRRQAEQPRVCATAATMRAVGGRVALKVSSFATDGVVQGDFLVLLMMEAGCLHMVSSGHSLIWPSSCFFRLFFSCTSWGEGIASLLRERCFFGPARALFGPGH
jgi:hypothetical protein